MRLGTKRLLRVYLGWIIFGAGIGGTFGAALGASIVEPRWLGAALGLLSGALDAAAIVAVADGIRRFLPRTRPGRALFRAPLAVVFAAHLLVISGVSVCFIVGQFGPRMTALIIGGGIGHKLIEQLNAKIPVGLLVAVILMVAMFFVLLDMLARLVGERNFRDLALARYRDARFEERFFLFVDIVGSTPLAERVGPAAMHRFLSRIFTISSDPIDDHAGAIYQYVGDEMVVTWTLPEGRPDARPVACFFAIEQAVRAAAVDFEREFGSVPRLRAALHAGEVMTGEVGGSRRAIVFHGDVMNTASRLEQATRTLQRTFLASEAALSRIDSKEGYTIEDLGLQQLRGRVTPVRVYAVEFGSNV
jgi:adenylate cyclase